jgi:predicted secreted Zn-dependent protease
MRLGFVAGLAALSCLALAGHALAEIKVNTRTTTYPIVGRTGYDLLKQMDRKGPKHGFLTRAIAQTRYAVRWNLAWKSDGRGCRVESVAAVLDVTYNYPRVASKMTPTLSKRWNAFLRGVKKHEQMHGTIAQRMVTAAEKSITNLSIRRDQNCRAARAEVKRRVSAVYAKYEAEQIAFDAREHRDGGNVTRLVERLVR